MYTHSLQIDYNKDKRTAIMNLNQRYQVHYFNAVAPIATNFKFKLV